METNSIRQKLISDFSIFIKDDNKLEVLEGVFDAIKSDETISLVSDEHYLKVREEREHYNLNNKSTKSWEEVEQQLKAKYGF